MTRTLMTALAAMLVMGGAAQAEKLVIAGRDGGYAKALAMAVEAYSQKNPGVEVERLELPYGGLYEKATIAMREKAGAYDVDGNSVRHGRYLIRSAAIAKGLKAWRLPRPLSRCATPLACPAGDLREWREACALSPSTGMTAPSNFAGEGLATDRHQSVCSTQSRASTGADP